MYRPLLCSKRHLPKSGWKSALAAASICCFSRKPIRLSDLSAVNLSSMAWLRCYLLYPDPWPKRRQNKRRFISDETLKLIARVLKPGGQFRFASDIDHYVGWTLSHVMRSGNFRWLANRPDDWRVPWSGWESTRYELKAIKEGRQSAYLTFERV